MIHDLFPDTYMCHREVSDMLSPNTTVLDIGGIGRLQEFCQAPSKIKVTDQNKVRGSECKLSFKDNTFDTVVSINTLEHVPHRQRPLFIWEAIRIARNEIILVFPFNDEYEELKERIGHKHLSLWDTIPDLNETLSYISSITNYAVMKQFVCPITWHLGLIAAGEKLKCLYNYINEGLDSDPSLWYCTESVAYLVILRIIKNEDK